MRNVRFLFGTKARYLGLAGSHDPRALYFCTDTKEMYKGDDLYTDGFRVVDELPNFTVAAHGVLYIVDGNGYILSSTYDSWIQVLHAVADSIDDISDENVSSVSPSVRAMKEYVAENASVVSFETHLEFPAVGKPDVLYKANREKRLYQWNQTELKYEQVGESVQDIFVINGGNANG